MYRKLAEKLTGRVLARESDAYPWEDPYNMPDYVLWMLREIPKMEDTYKASRWIGWCLSRMETMNMLTNKESRELVRIFHEEE